MKLEDYKKLKAIQREKLKQEEATYRTYCLDCLRSLNACLCQHLDPFETKFEYVILMHPKEAKKQTVGTGRYTSLSLKNCRIIVGENFDDNNEVQNILANKSYYPFLLYPGDSAHNISKDKLDSSHYSGKRPLIFIIDGTWPCAKSMMRDSPSLHKLPRISFDSTIESKFVIKHQPAKYCLSTIESVYVLISELERQGLEKTDGKKEGLLNILEQIVKYQVDCANDPSRASYRKRVEGYKKPEERTDSARWEKRMILFEEKNYD
jgi:DTW domain-containing protein YfiP